MNESWIPNFTWILADLAVGGSFPVGKAALLAAEHGVGATIDLRSECCDDSDELEACGVRFLHLPTPDMLGASQPMLDEGVRFARKVRTDGLKLLIHCEHGIGRSALLALCVMVDRGFEPLEALSAAKNARAKVCPSESQYRAWTTWINRRSKAAAPSYHEFGIIAYRVLADAV